MIGIAAIFGYMIAVGWIADIFNLTADDIVVPDAPETDPSLFDLVGWFWDILENFFALSAFQVEGVHTAAIITLNLVSLMVIWRGLKMIRGV